MEFENGNKAHPPFAVPSDGGCRGERAACPPDSQFTGCAGVLISPRPKSVPSYFCDILLLSRSRSPRPVRSSSVSLVRRARCLLGFGTYRSMTHFY